MVIKNYIDIFLPYFDLLSFDFAGSGLSEGNFVTLGYCEREDVYSVICKARESFGVREVILWGRSMGASTALLYAAKYPGVKAVIADNAFADLELLVNDLANSYLPILPSFLVGSILQYVQEYIEEKVNLQEHTDLNIFKLKPLSKIEKITCPLFFIGSRHDSFVNVKHTISLHDQANKSSRKRL